MTSYETQTAALRVDPRNPNHHLYRNNGGNWWIHYRVYPTPFTAERVRRSLGTKSLRRARRQRDQILARVFPGYPAAEEGSR